MKKHISGYSKSKNYFDVLKDKNNDAIKNSKSLEEYHMNNIKGNELYESNPYTNVYKAISEIIMMKKKNEGE